MIGVVSGAGPLPTDIQPVANETRDRIITGLVTLIPFVAIGFAAWQVWRCGAEKWILGSLDARQRKGSIQHLAARIGVQ